MNTTRVIHRLVQSRHGKETSQRVGAGAQRGMWVCGVNRTCERKSMRASGAVASGMDERGSKRSSPGRFALQGGGEERNSERGFGWLHSTNTLCAQRQGTRMWDDDVGEEVKDAETGATPGHGKQHTLDDDDALSGTTATARREQRRRLRAGRRRWPSSAIQQTPRYTPERVASPPHVPHSPIHGKSRSFYGNGFCCFHQTPTLPSDPALFSLFRLTRRLSD